MSSSSTPRPAPEDILIRISRHEPRPGAGAAASPADALVPQHLGLGPRSAPQPAIGASRPSDDAAHRSLASTPAAWATSGAIDGDARAALHRERDERGAALRHAERRRRTSRTRSTTRSSAVGPSAVDPGRHAARRPPPIIALDARARRDRRSIRSGSTRPTAPATRRSRTPTRSLADAPPRRTRSTPPSRRPA